MNTVFVVSKFDPDFQDDNKFVIAVCKKLETAEQIKKKIESENVCNEISYDCWMDLVYQAQEFLNRREMNEFDNVSYPSIVYKYITQKYPLYILEKASKLYDEDINIAVIIEEIEFYD